jgi:hypothetical protein
MSSRIGPQAHLSLIVQVQSVERALGRQAGRGGMDLEVLAALRLAVPQIRTKGKVPLQTAANTTAPAAQRGWTALSKLAVSVGDCRLGKSTKAQDVAALLAYGHATYRGKQYFPNDHDVVTEWSNNGINPCKILQHILQ